MSPIAASTQRTMEQSESGKENKEVTWTACRIRLCVLVFATVVAGTGVISWLLQREVLDSNQHEVTDSNKDMGTSPQCLQLFDSYDTVVATEAVRVGFEQALEACERATAWSGGSIANCTARVGGYCWDRQEERTWSVLDYDGCWTDSASINITRCSSNRIYFELGIASIEPELPVNNIAWACEGGSARRTGWKGNHTHLLSEFTFRPVVDAYLYLQWDDLDAICKNI